ncbi:B12 lower ligand biosynthesis ThiC-like protein BzaB [Heliobacterium undosum]|uniref:Phosphomethylpyrimidine synthase n=1 Tax=Heliomicrobium undosum TaxID=121734 RepID=A0A845L7S9_9FIRM|nr:B12 lower ligand biosynthesis ThiC-like protein BzaB [Heliomicrobium undosum]MZP28981.1 B12 lower ligand biosynthesis ThiC-like protein BzaB [Heliomicrobium undosum]
MTKLTQAEFARNGIITAQMEYVARRENVSPETIRRAIAEGTMVILANNSRPNVDPVAIGKGIRTKVNASVGSSPDLMESEGELDKLRAAEKAGADTIMDLSSGGDIDGFLRRTLASTRLPVGTVPLYQVAKEAIERYGSVVALTEEDIFTAIEKHAEAGVDFMALHCALNMDVIERLRRQGRVTDIVSRGGAFMTGWMLHHGKENPLYARFDRVLEIAKRYDITLSIGDAIRPGAIADSLDRAQIQGLILVGELVQRALEAGVQVMVEGPGHVPAHHIATTIQMQKQLCHQVPYFVLGTLVTDIAAGYDHISSAIGATMATMAGADFICYVTPAEHLRLPTAEDVHQGVIAARIATHAGDIAKGIPGAAEWDLEMSRARKALDWRRQIELSIDPEHARQVRSARNADDAPACSMCGELCAMKVVSQYLGSDAVEGC